MKFQKLKREEKETFCTQCKSDITKWDGIKGHRILLRCESLYESGLMIKKYIYPQFEGDKYFCSNECLKTWINNNL